MFVKARQDGPVKNRAVYLALGINLEGEKELLGLWISETEGAKFWLTVFNELKNRGVQDCFVACVDGLTGLPEAIEAVFPQTQVQLLCIVHKVRNSLRYVSWKKRKAVAADLRAIYGAATISANQIYVKSKVSICGTLLRDRSASELAISGHCSNTSSKGKTGTIACSIWCHMNSNSRHRLRQTVAPGGKGACDAR